ncbi:MFS transporter [Microbacterium indicum]|uniref:MFS transporter n=1 Tax=Microbacterium indicum TaxID=358100 RepID=UPI003CCB831A
MPLRLFASRERTGAYIARFFYLAVMIGFFFFTTQFLQNVLGWNPLQAGLGFLPMSAVNFVVAMAIPRLTRRFGSALPLVVGIALTLAGVFGLSLLTPESDYLTAVAVPMLLIGVGQGLAFAPLTSSGIVGATAGDAGRGVGPREHLPPGRDDPGARGHGRLLDPGRRPRHRGGALGPGRRGVRDGQRVPRAEPRRGRRPDRARRLVPQARGGADRSMSVAARRRPARAGRSCCRRG